MSEKLIVIKKWIFIQPQDVWMFRSAKPFAAGQSFIARSMFPPNPQTMQGMIRAHVIEQSGVDWQAFVSRRDETLIDLIGAPASRNGQHKATLGNLDLVGPFVARRTNGSIEFLAPTPLDVVKNKDNNHLAVLKPEALDFDTDAPFDNWQPLSLSGVDGEYETASGWLDAESFAAYLAGNAPQTMIPTSAILVHDERVGLAIDYGRRASRESHLYHAEFVRPREGIGLVMAVEKDLVSNDSGYMTLGGESRAAYYETVPFEVPTIGVAQGNLKIVLLTPAYFNGGWQPENGDWLPWVGPDARLVSMAIGRPTPISGWDTARNQPKPLQHYVPAGSVYYFENATAFSIPFTQPIPDADFVDGQIDAGRLGFGSFAVGRW